MKIEQILTFSTPCMSRRFARSSRFYITPHDAPPSDEIAIVCAHATRGRPNSGVGRLAAG